LYLDWKPPGILGSATAMRRGQVQDIIGLNLLVYEQVTIGNVYRSGIISGSIVLRSDPVPELKMIIVKMGEGKRNWNQYVGIDRE
jgi:hypothetical protein